MAPPSLIENVLRDCYSDVERSFYSGELLSYLYSRKCISDEEKEQVTMRDTVREEQEVSRYTQQEVNAVDPHLVTQFLMGDWPPHAPGLGFKLCPRNGGRNTRS